MSTVDQLATQNLIESYPRPAKSRPNRLRHWGYVVGTLWGLAAYVCLVQYHLTSDVIWKIFDSGDKSDFDNGMTAIFGLSPIFGLAMLGGSPQSKLKAAAATFASFVAFWILVPKQISTGSDQYDKSRYTFPELVDDFAILMALNVGFFIGIPLVIQLIYRSSLRKDLMA